MYFAYRSTRRASYTRSYSQTISLTKDKIRPNTHRKKKEKKSRLRREYAFKTSSYQASHEYNARTIASPCRFLSSIWVSISNNNNLANYNNTETGCNKADVITGSWIDIMMLKFVLSCWRSVHIFVLCTNISNFERLSHYCQNGKSRKSWTIKLSERNYFLLLLLIRFKLMI